MVLGCVWAALAPRGGPSAGFWEPERRPTPQIGDTVIAIGYDIPLEEDENGDDDGDGIPRAADGRHRREH